MSEPINAARILVVDDDPALLAVIKRILVVTGEVTVLDSARAVSALIERGERFDLILSDVVMRQLTGAELHDQLHRTSPDQARRMMFMSGGFRGELPPRGFRLVAKPFTARELLGAVEERLHEWSRISNRP